MTDIVAKILIVDDRSPNLLAMQKTLELPDIEIYTAASGNDALVQMTQHEFAVILLDVQMPGMNGFETASLMQKSKTTREIPIIFVTAISTEEQYVFKGYEAGAVDYLFKPVNPNILISKIKVFANLYRTNIKNRKLIEEVNTVRNLKSIGVLAGGIAHDFNNLLTAIRGNIDLARMFCEQGGKTDTYLNRAINEVERAAQLTTQILTFSKGGSPIKKLVNINELIPEVCLFILSGSNCKYDIETPEGLYPVSIDTYQISQVLQNLLINAKEAMPGGGSILITLENIDINHESPPPLKQGKYIKISVIDNGPGIDPLIIDNIFDPYFSTKKTGATKGQGLGLSVCSSIIARHNGIIRVDSTPGSGTTFHIYLPVSDKNIQLQNKVGDDSLALESSAANTNNSRILIMDDEKMIREMFWHVLSDAGYEVILTENGEEAVSKFSEAEKSGKPVDLIIMDLIIPGGMGGKETVKKIFEINPQAKVMVSSGYADDPVIARYKDYGFCGVIKKPFSLKKLIKIIDQALR